MVAALAFTTNPKTRTTVAVNLTGDALTTARVIQVTHPGGYIETHTVTTNGSGAATVNIVPGEPGTLSATVLTAPTAASTIVAATTTTVVT